jgi:hypothetical protein
LGPRGCVLAPAPCRHACQCKLGYASRHPRTRPLCPWRKKSWCPALCPLSRWRATGQATLASIGHARHLGCAGCEAVHVHHVSGHLGGWCAADTPACVREGPCDCCDPPCVETHLPPHTHRSTQHLTYHVVPASSPLLHTQTHKHKALHALPDAVGAIRCTLYLYTHLVA